MSQQYLPRFHPQARALTTNAGRTIAASCVPTHTRVNARASGPWAASTSKPRGYLSRHWSQSAITTCRYKPLGHTHSAAKIRRRSLTFTFLRHVGHLLPLRTSPHQCMGRCEAWRKCSGEEVRKQHERPGPILEPVADAYVAEQMTCPGAGEISVPMRNALRNMGNNCTIRGCWHSTNRILSRQASSCHTGR